MGVVEVDVWGEDEAAPPSELTIKELNDICESMYRLKAEIADLEAKASEKNDAYKELEAKVLATLEAHNLSNFDSASGKIIRQGRLSVKQPADPEAKKKFFDYLREKGIFEEMVSVNSKTLTAYVKKEIENAEAEGKIGFVPPGLETPSRHYYLALRKK